MTLDVEQIKADREAGTPGPWSDGIDGNARVYGPDGKGKHSGLVAAVFKGRVNARRIARVPDLEAAFIEHTARIAELEAALEEIAGVGFDAPMTWSGSDADWDRRRANIMQATARRTLTGPATWASAKIAEYTEKQKREDVKK